MLSHVTRIAPSPTGLFHLGTARTALFNWLAARASGGRFILRIDDTDVARNDPTAIQVIEDAMLWLGLDHDRRFSQSERLDRYRAAANALVAHELAYVDGSAVRLARSAFEGESGNNENPRHGFHSWQDTVSGTIAISDKERDVIEGMVLLRSDGMPTYHFASVYDDMDCGVTWIIRGHDHLTNTPKHLAIWNALSLIEWSGASCPKPLWTHVGLITQNKKKLSKRDGAASVLSYRDEGFDPDAMFNWLLRMGWGPRVDDRTTKTIDRQRAIDLFLAGGNMRPSPSNIDTAMLRFLDVKYKATKRKALASNMVSDYVEQS